MSNIFSLVIPASLEKSKDGEWRVKGLASTESKDQQGEIIIQKGIDLTPIEQGQGYFNFDHKQGVENLVGVIDGYNQSREGLYVEGRLFKNHDKAKAIYQVMSSLSESDKGRVGLSVEGKILERDAKNPNIIKKCQIKNVAITFNPVNTTTYADLVKSMSGAALDFNANGESEEVTSKSDEPKAFTASEVINLIQKALGSTGAAATSTPAELKGGDALGKEDLKKKPVEVQKENDEEASEPKKLKTLTKSLFKANIDEILEQIQVLYPQCSREQLWKALKDRLNKRFPSLKTVD